MGAVPLLLLLALVVVVLGPVISHASPVSPDLYDSKQGVKMGIPSGGCDDGKTGLDVDWGGSAREYTCFLPKFKRWQVGRQVLEPTQHCIEIQSYYRPQHYCMDQKIKYTETIPTYGNHRPLWAVFGEYKYVPPQRWLHNIEHGSVVMLYHPCADYQEVEKLRELVRGCIRKHVITPYAKLSLTRPLALVAWGCRLEMSQVNATAVRTFIREKGLHGPEGDMSSQGQYDFKLLHRAEPPAGSDVKDSVLCPNQP